MNWIEVLPAFGVVIKKQLTDLNVRIAALEAR